MEKQSKKHKVTLVVGGVTLVGMLLFPASLITLGVGVALGYHGCKRYNARKEDRAV